MNVCHYARGRHFARLGLAGSMGLLLAQPAFASTVEPGFTVGAASISSYKTGAAGITVELLGQSNSTPQLTGSSVSSTTGTPFLEVQLPQGSTDGWASLKQSVTTWRQDSFSDLYTATASLSATTSPAVGAAQNYAWFQGNVSYENPGFVGQTLSLSVTVNGSYASAPALPGMPSLPSVPTQPNFLISTDGGTSFTTLSGNMTFSSGSYTATASSTLGSGSFLLYALGTAAMDSFSLSLSKSWTNPAVQTGSSIQTLSTTVIPAQPVPEPGQWAMLLSGLLLVGAMAGRRIS